MDHPFVLRFLSLVGLCVMVGIAWALSENRRAVSWRVVGWGLGLQVLLGIIVLKTRPGQAFFEYVKQGFLIISDASLAGAGMVFGGLTQDLLIPINPDEPLRVGFGLAFTVLPVIIFVSTLGAIFYHFT